MVRCTMLKVTFWRPLQSHAPTSALTRRNRWPRAFLTLLCVSVATLAHAAVPAGGVAARGGGRAVASALTKAGFAAAKVISDIDLTAPFRTPSPWRLVVIRKEDAPPPEAAMLEEHGPLNICFLNGSTPHCSRGFSWRIPGEPRWFGTPYHVLATRVVYAGRDESKPRLLLRFCGVQNGYGTCGTATALYRYARRSNRFVREFLNVKGRDNSPSTRFVEQGPLRGDVIVDYPTAHAPFAYWVELYREGKSGRYVRVLRYRGHTGYADGNLLEVADSEMPEILRRLGLWHPGEPLPVPAHLPRGCSHLVLRNEEEWCQ